ncbi:MAG: cytochrome c oxidase subunit [Acidimicrobiaceae bacterium]|jgi:cytochrome c oxidase subunit 2
MRGPQRWVRRLVLIPALFLLSSCSGKQNIFSPKGPVADKINKLQVPVFVAAGVVGVIVAVMLAYVVVTGIRRAKHDDDEEPEQIHGNTKLELTWTIVPFLILVAVAFPTVTTILNISHRPANAMKIDVYGQQWWWSYEYDLNGDGTPEIVTANELVIPAGRQIELQVHSRDVIHSFWIPALAGTRDAVPGRTQILELEADQPGEYDGQCKEYCGLSHANMRARAVALSQADFDRWLQDQQQDAATPAAGSEAAAGLESFKAKCASCHQINGVNEIEGKAALISGHAPNLTHLMSRKVFASATFPLWVIDTQGRLVFNRNQLETWLRDPPAQLPMAPTEARGMPNLKLGDAEIDQLIAYLQTLGPYPAGATAPGS